MREALIVWGGWSGHEPEKGAHILSGMLEADGFKVYIENTTEAFADPAIRDMSLIVPIYTMSKIEKEEAEKPDRRRSRRRGPRGLSRRHGATRSAIASNISSCAAGNGSPTRQHHRLPGRHSCSRRSDHGGAKGYEDP